MFFYLILARVLANKRLVVFLHKTLCDTFGWLDGRVVLRQFVDILSLEVHEYPTPP